MIVDLPSMNCVQSDFSKLRTGAKPTERIDTKKYSLEKPEGPLEKDVHVG